MATVIRKIDPRQVVKFLGVRRESPEGESMRAYVSSRREAAKRVKAGDIKLSTGEWVKGDFYQTLSGEERRVLMGKGTSGLEAFRAERRAAEAQAALEAETAEKQTAAQVIPVGFGPVGPVIITPTEVIPVGFGPVGPVIITPTPEPTPEPTPQPGGLTPLQILVDYAADPTPEKREAVAKAYGIPVEEVPLQTPPPPGIIGEPGAPGHKGELGLGQLTDEEAGMIAAPGYPGGPFRGILGKFLSEGGTIEEWRALHPPGKGEPIGEQYPPDSGPIRIYTPGYGWHSPTVEIGMPEQTLPGYSDYGGNLPRPTSPGFLPPGFTPLPASGSAVVTEKGRGFRPHKPPSRLMPPEEAPAPLFGLPGLRQLSPEASIIKPVSKQRTAGRTATRRLAGNTSPLSNLDRFYLGRKLPPSDLGARI